MLKCIYSGCQNCPTTRSFFFLCFISQQLCKRDQFSFRYIIAHSLQFICRSFQVNWMMYRELINITSLPRYFSMRQNCPTTSFWKPLLNHFVIKYRSNSISRWGKVCSTQWSLFILCSVKYELKNNVFLTSYWVPYE
jgi:hypothetical protein